MGEGSDVICGIGCRHGSNPLLLWLWCRPAAIAPIRPLAWEPLYAMGTALRSKKKKKACGTLEKMRTSSLWPEVEFLLRRVVMEEEAGELGYAIHGLECFVEKLGCHLLCRW